MARLKRFLIVAVSALPALAQLGPYQQCGGSGWTGETTCIPGYFCNPSSEWYSQCEPGEAPPVTTPPPPVTTPPPPVTTTPPPVTTTPPPVTTPPPPVTTLPPGGPPSSTCSAPSSLTLTNNARLTNPFTFADGTKKVTTANDWYCRREEIADLFQRLELGTLPARPSSVTGSLSGNALTVNVAHNGQSISYTASIEYPSGNGPFAAIIAVGGSSLPPVPDIAVVTFNNQDLALDNGTSGRGKGKFYDIYGSDHSASALMAWAWGVSRIIDALQTLPDARVDVGRLGVTGCSGNGRGALVAGAFEQRISLTIPQESGAGGAGCWRISDEMFKNGVGTVTASQLASQSSYFSTTFNQYAEQVGMLPFDHHLLAALVAPRGLLVLDNTQYDWLGPPSVFGCMKTANKVYDALGIADRMGVSLVGGHDHCVFPGIQYPEVMAFINKFLRGSLSEDTNYIKTDRPNNGGFDEPHWVDWTVPKLVAGPSPPGEEPPPTSICSAPQSLSLTNNARLTDPFTFVSGTKHVTTSDDWFCRREEIADLFQRLELGTLPARPSSVTGSISGTTLTVNVAHNGQSISYTAAIEYPAGNGPFPAIIAIGGSSLPSIPAVAVITFNNQEIALDNGTSGRGKGKFYDVYGSTHSASTLTAWTWGVSRIIDALQTLPNSNIDTGKLGVTGCSGNGRAALVTGAFEQRISLTIPQESGAGGAGCWRISDEMFKNGVGTVTASQLASQSSYFSTAFNQYADQVGMLPFDHHLLAALVAPRGLLVLDNTQYDWLGPPSVFGCMKTANKVYDALGIADRMGISLVGGHDHCVFPGSQYPEVMAFVNKFLRGSVSENTNFIKTDRPNNGGFDEPHWVDWNVPKLVAGPTPPPPEEEPPATACSAPQSLSLTNNARLTNPFTFFNGTTQVTTANDWFCRREEIGDLFQRLELGRLPARPTSVSGSVSGNTLTVNVAHNGQNISYTASIEYPAGDGPFPAIIAIGGSSLPPVPDIAVITFNNQEIAVDNGTSGRGKGKFYDVYGSTHSASTLTAWAWGVSRIIDVLQTLPNSKIDAGKLAVTGCSGNGRAALVTGAFEQRISLTIPQESGAGGAGCWRISDEMFKNGVGTVTASQLATQSSYFSTAFNQYADQVGMLPFDHHLLASLVAPRGLLVLDNTQYDWLGPPSVFGCMKTANKVYEALGIADRMGISLVGGHDHCVFPGSQYPEFMAFINKFLRGYLEENTNVIKTDRPNNGGFDEPHWVDWNVPQLVAGPPPPPPEEEPPATVCSAPQSLSLTNNARLTNPFTFVNGTGKVATANDWFCRREEIADLFQRLELGRLPARPTSVGGSVSGNILTVTVGHNNRSISYTASIEYPAGNGPFPAIIAIGGSSLPPIPDIAVITFNNQAVAIDNGTNGRGKGKFYDIYGSAHSASTLMAWTWGVSRIIDALQALPDAKIDTGRLAVTGCSGNGKGALIAGAFDQRISLTIPQESGAGGAGCWRISAEMLKNGTGTVTAGELANQTSYFSTSFNQNANQVNMLPFDHHMLAALVAPRGLLVLDNTQYAWLGPPSVFGCMRAANKVYDALGMADRMGLSMVGGHDHCVFPGSQYPELMAYVNKFLRGNLGEDTYIMKTDAPNNGGFYEPHWVDWSVPELVPPQARTNSSRAVKSLN